MSEDKFTIDYSKRRHSSDAKPVSRDDLVLNVDGVVARSINKLVGPAFLGCKSANFNY
jgi:hypothetical protein